MLTASIILNVILAIALIVIIFLWRRDRFWAKLALSAQEGAMKNLEKLHTSEA